MSKQNNFRLSKTKNNILYILSGASLALFAGLMLFPTINETTHAEGDEPDDGITVVANNNIEINLLSTDQGYYKIAKDTVTVSTGSEYGYTLYLSTDSVAHQSIYLNGDTSSESKISGTTGTYESPAALADEGYSWGWAVPGISHFDNVYNTTNPDAKSKFAVMPLENKIIHEYTTEATEDTTDVYYGFKLEGTLEPGEYETAISYTAVSADAPLVARAILGDNGNLNFVYDRNTYTAGDAYTDNIGETTITNVYEVPTDAYVIDTEEDFSTEYCPSWVESDLILYANFDESFYGFEPTSTSCWFYSLENLASVTNANRLNTSDVTNMHSMFERAGYSAATFSLDLSSWGTGNVTDMAWMFSSTGSNTTTWSIGNLSGWGTSSVTNMCGMFSDAGRNATTFDIGDLSGWNTGSVTNMDSMFFNAGYYATTWDIGDLSGWDTGSVTNMSSMFNSAGFSATTWDIGDLSGWDTGSVTDMSTMFNCAGFSATTWDIGDLSGWDTNNTTNMYMMFNGAGSEATIWNIGDISGWSVAKVTDHSEFIHLNANESNASVVNNQPNWPN